MSSVTRARVMDADRKLLWLGRGAAGVRLRIGRVLEGLVCSGGIGELGFSSLRAYAVERCQRSGPWANESRLMAAAVDERGLVAIDRAMNEGMLSWSMAKVIVPKATAENEASLLAEARGKTVRRMKAWVRGDVGVRSKFDVEEDEDDDEMVTLQITMGEAEALMVEATRRGVDRVDGQLATDRAVMDAWLGEAQSGLLVLEGDAAAARAVDEEEARRLERLASAREEEERAMELADARLSVELPVLVRDDDLAAPLGSDPHELDAESRRWCAVLASRDLELGQLWRFMVARRGWVAFGYRSAKHYASRRLGLSESSLNQHAALARIAERLPALAAAIVSRKLGWEVAMLIGKVATPSTVDAWIARVDKRTVKHVREEVEAVLLRERLCDDPGPLLPPSADELADAEAFDRAAMSGELLKDIEKGMVPGRQMSIRSGSGRQVRLRVSAGQAAYFHHLERRFRCVAAPEISFVAFLCFEMWREWSPVMREVIDKWDQIYRRDCYRCGSPVCTGRTLSIHHLQFRSHGGTDDPANTKTLCDRCHLQGVHGGTIKASPPAWDILWEIGREPIMRVQGRDRTLLERPPPQ